MIVIPNKFTFVATPRTGSRAISEALIRKYPDAITEYPNDHHAAPDSVPTDLPIYTVLRNPLDQLLSWWAHVDLRHNSWRGPIDFALEYENVMYLPKYDKFRLNIYGDVATVFMPYDRGLRRVADALDLRDIETVGKSDLPHISQDEILTLQRVLDNHFKYDMALWGTYHSV